MEYCLLYCGMYCSSVSVCVVYTLCFVGIQDQCWQQPTSIQKLINNSDHETGHVIG